MLHWLYVFLLGSHMTKWVGCATLVNVMMGLLKDPIITAELAKFISGLKQYNPKIFAV